MMTPHSWLPSELSADAVLVASCPEASRAGEHDEGAHDIDRAVLPIEHVRFDQELFGYGGQLRLFAERLKEFGRRLFFVAAPEIFSSDESFRHFAQMTGRVITPSNITHFRFGTHRSVRLLKRAKNIVVSAETHHWQALNPDAHPFADGVTVPASVALVLMLNPHQSGLMRIDVGPCQTAYLELSIRHSATAPADAASTEILFFNREGDAIWYRAPRETPAASHTILLPWNVSFAGSVVPDLIGKIAGLQAGSGPDLAITVLPYNCPRALQPRVRSLPQHIQLNAPSARRYKIQFARLRDFRAAGSLLQSARLLWLEAADPEYLWMQHCVASLGVPTALIENVAIRAEADPGVHRFTISADRSVVCPLGSHAPNSAAVIRCLSHQALRQLLRASNDAGARAV